MSERTRDEVLDKIKKMLALANDAGAAEGERNNAMRMAFAWIKKYNLTMDDVEKSTGKTVEEDRSHSKFYYHHAWSRDVSNAIGKLFFCFYYFSGTQGAIQHNFIGKVTNVIAAIQLAQFLCESITKEGRKLGKLEAQLGGSAGAFERNFAKGAAIALVLRCRQMREEAEKEKQPKTATGTALVLASLYNTELVANQHYAKLQGIATSATKDRQKEAGEGFEDGVRYGKNVHLGSQIGGASANKKLK